MDLVQIFNQIRDIPYRIPVTLQEENNSCSGKCIKLKLILDSLGYKANYRVCDFLRNELAIPDYVLNTKHENLSTHVYLEVMINDKIIILDPTRDKGISKVLQVNERDGSSNTHIAVKPTKLYSLSDSQAIMTSESQEETEHDLLINGEFYSKFNQRLEGIRNK